MNTTPEAAVIAATPQIAKTMPAVGDQPGDDRADREAEVVSQAIDALGVLGLGRNLLEG